MPQWFRRKEREEEGLDSAGKDEEISANEGYWSYVNTNCYSWGSFRYWTFIQQQAAKVYYGIRDAHYAKLIKEDAPKEFKTEGVFRLNRLYLFLRIEL